MRWLLAVLSLFLLGFCGTGCTVRQAQRNTQTALDAAMDGVVAADASVDEGLPGAIERAGDQAIANGCNDLRACMDAAEDILHPWTAAVTGMRHALDTLYLLQDGLNLWIATGGLPDWEPVCAEVEETFGSLLALLAAVGLQPPERLSSVVPHVDTACRLVVSFVDGE